MNYISKMRLINRALINEDRLIDVVNLSIERKIPLVLGTDGNYEHGPFIDAIYKKNNTKLTVSDFKSFCEDLCPMLDVYNGTREFTFLEFALNYSIVKDVDVIQGISHVVYYREHDPEIIWETVSEPILSFKPIQQSRLTQEDIEKSRNTNFIFVGNS